MRRGTPPLILAGLGIVVLLGFALCPGPRPRPNPPGPPPQDTQIIGFGEPLRYCVAPRLFDGESRVQVLVDGSGSMGGVKVPALRYVQWIEQSISRSRLATRRGAVRIAQFDRKRGIQASSSFSAFQTDYQAVGDTTLHLAIASSADWDVTYILTDGVDASGSGTGDCAGGVDAACVARAFEGALLHPRGPSADEVGGLWLFPLRATHHGAYYTERPVALADFDPQALKTELTKLYSSGTAAPEGRVLVDVHTKELDKAGNLKYQYHGPRSLLLIVIARSDEIGRAAVASLVEVAGQNGVDSVPTSARIPAPDRLQALTPIEIYPGWLPQVEWSRLNASGETRPSGTIAASLRDNVRLIVDCPANKRGEADYLLAMNTKVPSNRCIDLYQLPKFEYRLEARNATELLALGRIVPRFSRDATDSRDQLTLHLTCENGGDRPCDSNPIHASYVAARRFDLGISVEPTAAGPAQEVVAFSTDDPVREPHRIYGLRQLLSFFYDDIAIQKPRSMKLADITICNAQRK